MKLIYVMPTLLLVFCMGTANADITTGRLPDSSNRPVMGWLLLSLFFFAGVFAPCRELLPNKSNQ
jgi:hypothetical protein